MKQHNRRKFTFTKDDVNIEVITDALAYIEALRIATEQCARYDESAAIFGHTQESERLLEIDGQVTRHFEKHVTMVNKSSRDVTRAAFFEKVFNCEIRSESFFQESKK